MLVRIVAVMTCFNRSAKTKKCIESLLVSAKFLSEQIELDIIVADDGSTDDTSKMLAQYFPSVIVLNGDGNLYWAGGMRMAYGQALTKKYDFYLWLNDDTVLLPNALAQLLATHGQMKDELGEGIVVGATYDNHGKVSYGGRVSASKIRRTQFALLPIVDSPQPCQTFNGNCVLISWDAAQKLGNLDTGFAHALGDLDYGLRATMAGVPVWVSPSVIGECNNDHDIKGSYLDQTLPFSIRWQKLMSPKGLPPHSWAVFCRRHTGILWPVFWVWPYVRVMITSLRQYIFFGRNRG